MKKKRLPFLKALSLCLFLSLGSCEREEAIDAKTKESPISFDLSKKTWKELEDHLGFKESLLRLSKKKGNLTGGNALRTAMEATEGFTISEGDVTVAQMQESTTYTMHITRPETDTTFFENLVLDIPQEGEPRAVLVKYTPTEAMKPGPHGTPTFVGTKEITPIAFDASQVLQRSSGACVRIVIKWCDNGKFGGTGEKHMAGDGCNNEEHIWYETIWFGGCGGGGGIGGGGDSGPGGEGPGPGPGTGPGGPGGIGGGPGNGGGPPIGTTPTVPTGPGQQQGIVTHEEHCLEFKKLITNTNIKNTFNGPNGLESKVNEPREYGNAFKRNPNFDSTEPIPRNSTNPAILNMANFMGGFYYGANHTHPDPYTTDYVPMFPAQDIRYLAMVAARYDWNGTPRNDRDYSIFVLTLTVPEGTFAIKINDWLKLNSVINNAEKYKRMEKEIQDEFKKLANTDMDGLTKALLKVLHDFDMGISLYKAEQNLSKWNKLSLSDPNDQSSAIDKIPCN